MFDADRFITDRVRAIDASGIRRVFDLAADLDDPIDLSIGQPDFDVPEPVKEAACQAIRDGFNRYTQTQGIAQLRSRIARQLNSELPETYPPSGPDALGDDTGLLISSGVSGGLLLALLACVGPGDEVLIPDPYFVMYRHLVTLAGATPVYVDTYPDFQPAAARFEPHITPRTKLILLNSPSNPTGVVASWENCREMVELAERHNLLLLSDEIYDVFCYEPAADDRRPDAPPRCPTPAAYTANLLMLRGFSKTYAMTGWRMGYAVGPRPIIEQMTKLQQYSFVCAPSMAQVAAVAAMDLDMHEHVDAYRAKRDRVVERLSSAYNLTPPGGAFYAFAEVPPHLSLTATAFVERAVARGLLIIPGSVFSQQDTHFRLSYACDNKTLERGLDVLLELSGEGCEGERYRS